MKNTSKPPGQDWIDKDPLLRLLRVLFWFLVFLGALKVALLVLVVVQAIVS